MKQPNVYVVRDPTLFRAAKLDMHVKAPKSCHREHPVMGTTLQQIVHAFGGSEKGFQSLLKRRLLQKCHWRVQNQHQE